MVDTTHRAAKNAAYLLSNPVGCQATADGHMHQCLCSPRNRLHATISGTVTITTQNGATKFLQIRMRCKHIQLNAYYCVLFSSWITITFSVWLVIPEITDNVLGATLNLNHSLDYLVSGRLVVMRTY